MDIAEMLSVADRWPLHRAVFDNDAIRVAQLLDSGYDPIERDVHGNTPLHIAVMCSHKACIDELLVRNTTIKVKNNAGWSPFAEAISVGDRETIGLILKAFKKQTTELVQSRREHLVSALKSMGDFRLVLKWDFQSWVPFLSRVLPSDVCTITKKGSSLRLDTTLVDFSEMRWVRGDISFIFWGDSPSSNESLTVIDNEAKVFQRINTQKNNEAEFERELDLLMSNDIVTGDLSTKSIEFSRAQSGWFWKEDRSELIGSFAANYYNVSGISLRSRRRREHLSSDDLDKNRAILEAITSGNVGASGAGDSNKSASSLSINNNAVTNCNSSSTNNKLPLHASSSSPALTVPSASESSPTSQELDVANEASELIVPSPVKERSVFDKLMLPDEEHRKSLLPPERQIWTWEQYLASPDGHLGREMVIKESRHSFKLTLAMSEEFPLTVESLLDVLEVIAPLKHFQKLRDFVEMKLPPGFPVKIELPVLPAITARVTFNDFQFSDSICDSLFRIPAGYLEDATRFPDL